MLWTKNRWGQDLAGHCSAIPLPHTPGFPARCTLRWNYQTVHLAHDSGTPRGVTESDNNGDSVQAPKQKESCECVVFGTGHLDGIVLIANFNSTVAWDQKWALGSDDFVLFIAKSL